jgi:hypothetical protein
MTYAHVQSFYEIVRILFVLKKATETLKQNSMKPASSQPLHGTLGWASRLLGFRHIPLSWHMVVMGKFTEEYKGLHLAAQTKSTPAVWNGLKTGIQSAITSFHDHDYVRDIRPPNIMVNGDLYFKVINFD